MASAQAQEVKPPVNANFKKEYSNPPLVLTDLNMKPLKIWVLEDDLPTFHMEKLYDIRGFFILEATYPARFPGMSQRSLP
jgi:hypothetical protein